MRYVVVCLGSQPDLCDVHGELELSAAELNATLRGLRLQHGSAYYLIVEGHTSVNRSSRAHARVVCDATPPVMLQVNDGLQLGLDVQAQTITDALFGNWLAEDDISGIEGEHANTAHSALRLA